jgi:hypothetical protein
MSEFRGYGSGERAILLMGALVGFFIGLSQGGILAGLAGAMVGSVGLLALVLLTILAVWAIGRFMDTIRRALNKPNGPEGSTR